MMNVRFTFQILKTTFLFTVQEVLLFFYVSFCRRGLLQFATTSHPPYISLGLLCSCFGGVVTFKSVLSLSPIIMARTEICM